MKCLFALILFGVTCVMHANPIEKVESKIWKDIEEIGFADIFVTFKKANTKAAFARFESLKLTNRIAKLNTQYAILKGHADKIQGQVISMLKKMEGYKKHEIIQLWISAELVVRNVDRQTVEALANHPDVKNLTADLLIPLPDYTASDVKEVIKPNGYSWGTSAIRADLVQAQGTKGQGIVVGSIDTGVRYTHVALKPQYRGNNNGTMDHNFSWIDMTTSYNYVPNDNNGHGTHVTGILIDVAPSCKFISCKGCAFSTCTLSALVACGNWMACPTDVYNDVEDCSKSPHIVNNSWGSTAVNQKFFDAVLVAWNNVGIVPVFVAGNSGPACSTLWYPGDRNSSITVGSTSANNVKSTFSSAGPTSDQRRKPDIAAPGENITSASHLSDTGYNSKTGTSMACPHVAGAIALFLSHSPGVAFTIDSVRSAFTNGAVAVTPSNLTCGEIPDSVLPNNHVGYGRIDAYNSVYPATRG